MYEQRSEDERIGQGGRLNIEKDERKMNEGEEREWKGNEIIVQYQIQEKIGKEVVKEVVEEEEREVVAKRQCLINLQMKITVDENR